MNDIINIYISDREKLLRNAFKIVKNVHQAEEIVQDAYFKLADYPQTGLIKNQRSFCYKVVRNLAIDWYRRKTLEENIFTSDEGNQLNQAHERTPERDACNSQKVSIVAKIMGKFPRRTQTAFEMHYFKGMTQRQIASSLGISATLVNFMIKEATTELAAA